MSFKKELSVELVKLERIVGAACTLEEELSYLHDLMKMKSPNSKIRDIAVESVYQHIHDDLKAIRHQTDQVIQDISHKTSQLDQITKMMGTKEDEQ